MGFGCSDVIISRVKHELLENDETNTIENETTPSQRIISPMMLLSPQKNCELLFECSSTWMSSHCGYFLLHSDYGPCL